jgi:hypothetical protein
MSSRELLEKAIARILHRHCNFGWAHYYIPSEKFPSLIEELIEVVSPAGQVSHEELVQFFLRTQRLSSAQERAARFEEEFAIYRRYCLVGWGRSSRERRVPPAPALYQAWGAQTTGALTEAGRSL